MSQLLGVSPSRLAAVGYGEYHPIADNSTEEGRAQNRRISLMVAKNPRHRPIGKVTSFKKPVYDDQTNTPSLQPVILEEGEYLFSSDPDLSRK